MDYLSLCSLAKNEEKYIFDYYKIHKALGVDKFLFFDRSDAPREKTLSEIFKDYPDVEIQSLPEPLRHVDGWMKGIEHFKGKTKFLMLHDVDQVLFPVQETDLKSLFSHYEGPKCGAINFNWHTFGSSHRETEPEEGTSTYEAYTWRAVDKEPINAHTQTTVRPERVKDQRPYDPHHVHLEAAYQQINEYGVSTAGPFNNPISQDKAFVAHYYTRSREYWRKKLAKGRADIGQITNSLEEFDEHQTYMNKVEDTRIKDFYIKNVINR